MTINILTYDLMFNVSLLTYFSFDLSMITVGMFSLSFLCVLYDD